MDDRYRFRAWHKERKQMHDVLRIDYYDKGYNPPYIDVGLTDDDGFGVLCPLRDFELMQCVGDNDLNGNLIFEGDIISCNDYHGARCGDLAYYQGSFYLRGSDGKSDEHYYNLSEIVVIDNIYDNIHDLRR